MASWVFATRISIFILNLVMLLAALALIGVGFWMRYDDSFDHDLKSVIYKYDDPATLSSAKFDVRVWLIVAFWSIIGLAFGAVVTAAFGMLSFFIRRRWVLMIFIILITILIIMEIGSAVALIVERGSLRDTISTMIAAEYSTNSVQDVKIIQDTYHCCGTVDGALNNIYCSTVSQPTCDVAVFDSVDNTMMISGIILLVIVIFQIAATVLPIPLVIGSRGSSKVSHF